MASYTSLDYILSLILHVLLHLFISQKDTIDKTKVVWEKDLKEQKMAPKDYWAYK